MRSSARLAALLLIACSSGRDRPAPLDSGGELAGSVDVAATPPDDSDGGADTEPRDALSDAPDVSTPAAGDPFSCAGNRVEQDQLDDTQAHQVRALYVLPADGADQRLDVDGRLCRSILAATRWLQRQTGGAHLRFDTHDGVLDVGFVRLTVDDAALAGSGGLTLQMGHAYLRDRIEAQLQATGLIAPRKVYAVYYGGSSPYSCGGGAWPPTLPGKVAALYLGGRPAGAAPCSSNPIGAALDAPGYVEYSLLHELLHTLGMVAAVAPHHHAAGHSFDHASEATTLSRDLMYAARSAGDPGWATNHALGLLLDVGRDDYYDHGRPDLVDLARSAFLTPLPATPQLPPGWTAAD